MVAIPTPVSVRRVVSPHESIHSDHGATAFDKEELLCWFFYHLPWDEEQQINRAKLIRELPGAYNRYVGQEVAEVRRASDGVKF